MLNKKQIARWLVSTSLACLVAAHSVALAQNTPKQEPQIKITPATAQQVTNAPTEHFTGTVEVRALFGVNAPARGTGGLVTFQPGARSAWHTHPLGQYLIVTEGTGWIQQWGGPVQVMRKGDVIWIPAGVKHWHGATSTSSVSHMALQEVLDGKNVDWLEKVTDQQYASAQ